MLVVGSRSALRVAGKREGALAGWIIASRALEMAWGFLTTPKHAEKVRVAQAELEAWRSSCRGRGGRGAWSTRD
jgi:hypothetical protein